MMPLAALDAKMSLICSPNPWLRTNTTIPQQWNIVSRPQGGSYQHGRRDLISGFNFRAAQTIDALSSLLYRSVGAGWKVFHVFFDMNAIIHVHILYIYKQHILKYELLMSCLRPLATVYDNCVIVGLVVFVPLWAQHGFGDYCVVLIFWIVAKVWVCSWPDKFEIYMYISVITWKCLLRIILSEILTTWESARIVLGTKFCFISFKYVFYSHLGCIWLKASVQGNYCNSYISITATNLIFFCMDLN